MNIGIIGMGLIGGSLGKAIIKNTNHKVFGFDIDETTMLKAELLNAQSQKLNMQDYSKLDIVIIALCPNNTIEIMQNICPVLKDGATIIDTCGNKRKVVSSMQELQKAYPKLNFVGCHPMAGREFSGISHASANLFERAYIILVTVTSNVEILSKVKQLFLDIKAQDVEFCSAEKHDKMIAYTSQLAHIVSSSYVKSEHTTEHAGFSAGSFKDMTRVAKLNSQMWTELFLENKDNLVNEIEVLIKNLEGYKDAIKNEDDELLQSLLEDGVKMKEKAEKVRKERLNDSSKSRN